MQVLAIYNLKGNETLLARELAAVLGRTVYEMSSRVRAPGGGPSVMASFADPRPAQDAAAVLRARGFDVLLLDASEVETDARRFVVRGCEMRAEDMTVESRSGKLEVRYQDVDLVLRGIKILHRQAAAPRTTRKLSLTRAALTGGLVLTKTVQAPRPPAAEEREGFLHLYGRGLPPLAWRESEIRYRPLGGALLPSRQANFAQLAAELRRRCARAVYDERLGSRAGQAQLLGPTLAAADHLDLAISLLAAVLRTPPG